MRRGGGAGFVSENGLSVCGWGIVGESCLCVCVGGVVGVNGLSVCGRVIVGESCLCVCVGGVVGVNGPVCVCAQEFLAEAAVGVDIDIDRRLRTVLAEFDRAASCTKEVRGGSARMAICIPVCAPAATCAHPNAAARARRYVFPVCAPPCDLCVSECDRRAAQFMDSNTLHGTWQRFPVPVLRMELQVGGRAWRYAFPYERAMRLMLVRMRPPRAAQAELDRLLMTQVG